MKTSEYLLATLKDTPADTEIISHQLMLRAGMIRKIASGIYTWLPLGLRVLRKVEAIIREEMDNIGGQELLMPVMQPADLWKASGRWEQYGPELVRLSDRHQRPFCLGPTHEEVITFIVKKEIKSYQQLPCIFYQIQSKFRDEIRPRFGVMRGREFLMKDAYSFHLTDLSLARTYQVMFDAYVRIFTRLDLQFKSVIADTGNIGGHISHEFHVLADSGEDQIVFSNTGNYAANMELAKTVCIDKLAPSTGGKKKLVDTLNQRSISEICAYLKIPKERILKTLLVKAAKGGLVALVLRGDHELNRTKAERLPEVAIPLAMAKSDEIVQTVGCLPGFIGPIDLKIPIIVDQAAAIAVDFVCGANIDNKHFVDVNWQKDLLFSKTADLRNVCVGDFAPDGQGRLQIKQGIEVGHIFQLGVKYSQAMKANCLNKNGQAVDLFMGCYGIGVSRVVAAAIEQNFDARGIIWPASMAPFQLALIPINMHKSQSVRDSVMALYQQLSTAHIEILLDDRKERPGVIFSDMELIGIPHSFIISERGLNMGQLEYRQRSNDKSEHILIEQAIPFILDKLK